MRRRVGISDAVGTALYLLISVIVIDLTIIHFGFMEAIAVAVLAGVVAPFVLLPSS